MKILRYALALALALGLPGILHAADVVTASVLPGAVVNDTNTLVSGVKTTNSVRLPDAWTTIDFANGTAAQQVSVQHSEVVSLAASASATLDLTTLTGGTGAATFAKLKVAAFYAGGTPATGPTVTVGGGDTNPFLGPLGGTTPTYTIGAGAAWVAMDLTSAGWTIDATHKTIKLVNNSSTAATTVTVVFAGN